MKKKKKKIKKTHVKTILVENWILFMFCEIFDFREISRPLMNSIENSNLGIIGKYREIRGEFRQVSAKKFARMGKVLGGEGGSRDEQGREVLGRLGTK